MSHPHYSRTFYQAVWFHWAKRLATFIPRRILRWVGYQAGLIYSHFHSAKVQVVKKNLALIHASTTFQNAQKVFGKFGACLADYFYLSRYANEKKIELIKKKKGYEYLVSAYQKKQGAILVTAHLGLFELGGVVMNELGFPMAVLTLPEPNQALTQWRANYRKLWKAETITIGDDPFSFLKVLNYLKAGNFVAALIDRPSSQKNIPVRLPHGEAFFSGNILLIALLAQCPVIPAVAVAESTGFYEMEAFEPFYIENQGTREETIAYYTQKIADVLLPTICHHYDQWFQFVSLSSV
ncbi:MAG: lysophospholipid acyltransferase family protein [Verrucomicrobiae bacterium]|nr:lysophospholipid acyltransferase family protein [Verrucomicrobiae bacterium]